MGGLSLSGPSSIPFTNTSRDQIITSLNPDLISQKNWAEIFQFFPIFIHKYFFIISLFNTFPLTPLGRLLTKSNDEWGIS